MEKDDEQQGGFSRRDVLSIGAAVGVAGGVGIAAAPAHSAEAMPDMEIARLSELSPGDEFIFEYPDENSPAVLLNLDGPVEGGVGPNENLVAYSLLCTHKGCPVSWNAEQQMLICPCHWSSFDPAKKGRLIIGQGSQSLPQIKLAVTGDAVHATGVVGLIYGRQTNVL